MQPVPHAYQNGAIVLQNPIDNSNDKLIGNDEKE
jgi:hypothetical protein